MDMSTITHSRARRVVAAAGAIALATLGLAGLAGPASAANIGDVGNIDSTEASSSSIIVTKYEKAPGNGTAAGDGTPLGDLGDTIEGVEFTASEVVTTAGLSLDLLSNEGWTAAATIRTHWLANGVLPTGYQFVQIDQDATDSNGQVTFVPGHFGLFFVAETDGPAEITDPAQPFFVTLPFPTGTLSGNTNEWLYDVNVYPKNAVTGLTKVVNTSYVPVLTQASYVVWTITSDVPELPATENLTTFDLVDTIDTDDLAFVAVSATPPAGVSDYAVRAYAAGSTTALAGLTPAMYTIDESAAADGTLTLDFNPTGLAYLQANAHGGSVEFDVLTRVLTPGNTEVVNNVTSHVNDSELHRDAEQPFGELLIFKYATTTGSEAPDPMETPLVGAVFQLYSDTNGNGDADPTEIVTIAGETSWTVTNADGTRTIEGIKPGDYLLVESAAPAGYRTPSSGALGSDTNPIAVEVREGAADEGTGVNYEEVQNYQMSPWELPFTGGNGVITFTVAGAGLMALALGFGFVAIRRRKQTEQAEQA